VRLISDYDNEMSLVTSAAIDRERWSQLRLMVTCRDGGQPVRETVLRLAIVVDDVNDNAPRFTQAVYNVSVVENQRTPLVCIYRRLCAATRG